MDFQRLLLFLVFSLSLLMLWQEWQKEQQGVRTPPQTSAKTEVPKPATSLPAAAAPDAPPTGPAGTVSGTVVTLANDLLALQIDTTGAALVRAELLKHRHPDDKTRPMLLFERGAERVYLAQSGLIGEGLPNHKSAFVADSAERVLKAGEDAVSVRFTASGGGVELVKTYTLRRGSYVVESDIEVRNTRAQPLSAHAYYQFVRDSNPAVGESRVVPTYTGPAIYTSEEKFQKVSFDDIGKGKRSYPKQGDNGWVAILQHYFLAAWLPADKSPREYFTRKLEENLFAAGVIVPLPEVAPGAAASEKMRLYVGPQEQDSLAALAEGLELTVDYGWLTVIAVPLFWVLNLFHKWVHNWGVAIILLTVVIKLIFYPLSAASYRSMAKMKAVTPRLQRIKELYGHDRQKLHQAMMELYKEEKINPLGGCLPILIQIPVFIALYWVLLASVELRHAPFYGWIQDLSAPDPWYVLPVVMGVTMFIQSKLNPTPPDPIQARVMQIMPIAFSIFFFFFPAGLVLYWLVNNVISIAQQWAITRSLERAAAHAKA